MPDNHSKRSDRCSDMTVAFCTADDARQLLIFAAGDREWGTNRKSWLGRAAARLGITPRRAKALFYGEPVKLGGDEYLRICQRAAAIERAINEQKAAQDELAQALARARAIAAGGVLPVAGEGGDADGHAPLLHGTSGSAGNTGGAAG